MESKIEQNKESGPPSHDEISGFERVYKDIKSPGEVWRHEKVLETVDDYPDVYEIATDKAKLGCHVQILPILNERDSLREKIFSGSYERKCPDMLIDGVFTDVKTITGEITDNSIDNNIRKAARQAPSVVIRIPGDVGYYRLLRLAANRFKRHPELEKIEFKLIGIRNIELKRADIKN